MVLSSRRSPAIACVLAFNVLLIVTAVVARREEAADRVTLDALAPLVMTAANAGAPLIANVRAAILATAASIAVFAALAAYHGWRRSRPEDALLAGVVLLAVAAEVSVVSSLTWLGVMLITGAVLLGWFAAAPGEVVKDDRHFGWVDFAVLLAITCLAIAVRLFAINRLPADFEGELAPYYLGATALDGILPANAGAGGPWAPMGLLFYVPLYLSTQFFGATLLAVRFSAAAVSLATLGLLYYFVLGAYGRTAAILAATFSSSIHCRSVGVAPTFTRTGSRPGRRS